ncbi:MAG: transcriptional repressor [Firmicutes bacterium]|nr:transcriptional repressor [Bacillota bacterium]
MFSEHATRMTRQRKAILETLRSTKSHPTADWIYEQVRHQIPDISLGTVYRNLKLLKEQGEILELNYGSTFSRYDGNAANHYHFRCEECGRVFDVDLPVSCALEHELEAKTGFEVHSHRLEFYGLCSGCRRKRESALGAAGAQAAVNQAQSQEAAQEYAHGEQAGQPSHLALENQGAHGPRH